MMDTLEEERDFLARQCKDLWAIIHLMAVVTRTDKEYRYPAVYKQYDMLCEEYGEVPVEPELLRDGLVGTSK